MRFLADENLHAKLLPFLRSLGHDIRPVVKGTPDSVVAAQAKADSCILLTHDTDFADSDRYPASTHAGIIVIRINPVYIEKTTAALRKLLTSVPESQLTGRRFLIVEETFSELKEGEFIPFS